MRISQMINDHAFARLQHFPLANTYLKIEAFNPAGSIKLKAALGLIANLEKQGLIKPDSILIESSSGNLGVALAIVCSERGYRFTCVVDPNASQQNVKTMKALGADIITVTIRDENGGYLNTRIEHIKSLQQADSRYVWLNQYANPENPRAHARTTAKSIAESFERLDYLFVGAGTTGTLMGCVQFFSEHRPETRIVAVDSVGSVTFGYPPSKRYIPGLGTSRRPEIFKPGGLFGVEMVPETNAVTMCRWLARSNGLLAGGSTGTVLAGVHAWRERLPKDAVVVAISPDLGERYLDTIYDDHWVSSHFGPHALSSDLSNLSLPPVQSTTPHAVF
ncbi:2,3-diaminopropionate biosynthesis protein SbnA [Paraherbaspirillum soli]|uniref:2,3-diaminopropionate biosynthesis protein SbnA n=1 Tax=Paraherbaspirillum soli TaxID=631222 RepID=A0ABW0M6U4_9BURK